MNSRLVQAWQQFFGKEADVKVLEGDITELRCDAIVSPANSFGFMDGGIDHAISERLGWNLQARLQEQIKALPEGELLVGRAMVLETGDEHIPFLISAPTMRVPMRYNINVSINAYLAMKGMLIAARDHPAIESVAVPGFCTGVGRMSPAIAAQQMYAAFREIVYGEQLDFSNYTEAQVHHYDLNPQGSIYGS